jgi:hypothetical protein
VIKRRKQNSPGPLVCVILIISAAILSGLEEFNVIRDSDLERDYSGPNCRKKMVSELRYYLPVYNTDICNFPSGKFHGM